MSKNSKTTKYSSGQQVYVAKFKTNLEVLEILPSGIYKLLYGSLQIHLKEEQLAEPKEKKSSAPIAAVQKTEISFEIPLAKESIDLHGYRVLEALQAVEQEIHRALLAERDRLKIVHGIGDGKLAQALHKHLPSLAAVKKIQTDALNPGVLWVFF